jgi:hypothetical protein
MVRFSGRVLVTAALGSTGFTTMVWYWFAALREPEQEAKETNKQKLPVNTGTAQKERYVKKEDRFIANRNTVCNTAQILFQGALSATLTRMQK